MAQTQTTQKTQGAGPGNGSSHIKAADSDSSFLDTAREQGENVLGTVKEYAKEYAGQAQEYADMAMEEIEKVPRTIKKYPLQSVLIGFGVGMLGGFLLRRSWDK